LIQKGKHIVIVAGALLISLLAAGQEDVVSTEAMLVEQEEINFQTFFFEAIQQKSIGNFDKAIFALEACNNIEKDHVAVLFELSKNYAFLFKYTEAEFYILRGLEKEPLNLYMLRHLKEIKTKQNDYPGAIVIQNRIVELRPEEEADLVILYIKSGEIDSAIALLRKLDSNGKVPEGLESLKESLLQEAPGSMVSDTNTVHEEVSKSKVDVLKEDFELKKDFESIKLLLEREYKTKQFLELLQDSEKGLNLFPAQPFLYLMHGRALNNLRKYGEALKTLEDGLDYLIDDDLMKVDFLKEISLSYKGMGNNKMASSFYQQAMELIEK
jgi:tetratricopeptide (TPR) repeat protein